MVETRSMSVNAGKNLKRIIKEKGFTQDEFAFQFGTDPANLRKWIAHGINKISTIEALSRFLNVGVMDILL